MTGRFAVSRESATTKKSRTGHGGSRGVNFAINETARTKKKSCTCDSTTRTNIHLLRCSRTLTIRDCLPSSSDSSDPLQVGARAHGKQVDLRYITVAPYRVPFRGNANFSGPP